MIKEQVLDYTKEILNNIPQDWVSLTTHRLDIYDESKAKSQFLNEFESLFNKGMADAQNLAQLPTAYDYIRLGHPLSSVLEWTIAKLNKLEADQVISFSSQTAPVLAVLRKNHLDGVKTQILCGSELEWFFDKDIIQNIYEYNFSIKKIDNGNPIPNFDGSQILVSEKENISSFDLSITVDFLININARLGSILIANGEDKKKYISEIQHVRRRETIAMTPSNCLLALKQINKPDIKLELNINRDLNQSKVLASIKSITGSNEKAVVGSSGLSIQYAIVMGLVHHAKSTHPDKKIKIIVPPNCYGGTNDQARRVANCIARVEVMDFPVDGDNDMVQSLDQLLDQTAFENSVPLIIAEIPTNPRVEVPDLNELTTVLTKERKTPDGNGAIEPVFILDQTFCPNVPFLEENGLFSNVNGLAYVSGSKFPSGGKCTAGYCVSNKKAAPLMEYIDLHLRLCDNEATEVQLAFLAEQMPSMLERIQKAYNNTREFVEHIEEVLPSAKINFVGKDLAKKGFTPSVFSLDLPTKGDTEDEKEAYKRELNLKLIKLMIESIPHESKFCVSYGQLKGCYWTIPATSTQGTTKEGDKDYIVRVALAPELDLEKHKEVFDKFVEEL
jgi:cystathionine beta-lyase/cystathionine gamma-synthase